MTVSECGPSSDPEVRAQLQKDAYNTSVSKRSVASQRLCRQEVSTPPPLPLVLPNSGDWAGHMLRCAWSDCTHCSPCLPVQLPTALPDSPQSQCCAAAVVAPEMQVLVRPAFPRSQGLPCRFPTPSTHQHVQRGRLHKDVDGMQISLLDAAHTLQIDV